MKKRRKIKRKIHRFYEQQQHQHKRFRGQSPWKGQTLHHQNHKKQSECNYEGSEVREGKEKESKEKKRRKERKEKKRKEKKRKEKKRKEKKRKEKKKKNPVKSG